VEHGYVSAALQTTVVSLIWFATNWRQHFEICTGAAERMKNNKKIQKKPSKLLQNFEF